MYKITLAMALAIATSFGGVAQAENTQFRQQILPIDCIYEVIDAGSQQLRYITPQTCPIDPGPPVVTLEPKTSDVSSPNNIGSVLPTASIISKYNPKATSSSPEQASPTVSASNSNTVLKQPQANGTYASLAAPGNQKADYVEIIFLASAVLALIFWLIYKRSSKEPERQLRDYKK